MAATNLKEQGFLKQAQAGRYSLRIHLAGGRLEASRLAAVQAIADTYGEGYIHLTARQAIEIPFIREEQAGDVLRALAEAGLEAASLGPRVRTVTACQGNAVCHHGLIDTQGLAAELDKQYYGRAVPHKFKIGITGCRNNCLKAEENDLGIKGAVVPAYNPENCVYCGACARICPVGAIAVNRETSGLVYNRRKCVDCGRCVKACPKKSWTGKPGYKLFYAGLFGNRIVTARQIGPVVHSTEALTLQIDRTIAFFSKHGQRLERLRTVIERVGWDTFRKALKGID